MTSSVDESIKKSAKSLYWQGERIAEIAKKFQIPLPTIYSWKRRHHWQRASASERIENILSQRLAGLICKDHKSNGEYKELDGLMRQLERIARIHKYENSGKESDLNPKRKGNHFEKRAPKNSVSDEQINSMTDGFTNLLFDYQKKWLTAKKYRIRNILKSRQVGATWFFAREALLDALTTGDNQIFLSASRAQAEVFRGYIINFAAEYEIKLSGNPIVLANAKAGKAGGTLYFLSTSSRTAQSYHGHVYFDEYFWVPKFAEFRKVASGMAMHKKWRQTYFSTPSAITHEAYQFWTGKGRIRGDKEATVEVDHHFLKAGKLGTDRQWRQIVTVNDAITGGCELFDLEELRSEYTEDEFNQLLMCEFIDDSSSVFGFNELLSCGVDSLNVWHDFVRSAPRPINERPIWLGYDPSRTRDNAAVCVIAPGTESQAPFRILEKIEWRGMDFVSQVEAIKKLTERYHVHFIGIDTTGIGMGVYDLVRNFYPAARAINYSPQTKSRMVLRVKELIRSRRLQFDSSWNDLIRAFLAIKRVTTNSGAITFEAARSEQSGHADLAWAVMCALEAQPINQISDIAPSQSLIEFI